MAEMGKLIDIVEKSIDKDQQRMRESMDLFDRYYRRMFQAGESGMVSPPSNTDDLDWIEFV